MVQRFPPAERPRDAQVARVLCSWKQAAPWVGTPAQGNMTALALGTITEPASRPSEADDKGRCEPWWAGHKGLPVSGASSLPAGPGAAGLFSAKSNLKTANTAGTVCPPSAVNLPFVRKISTGEGGSSPSQLQAKAGRTGSFNRPLCARLSHLPAGSPPLTSPGPLFHGLVSSLHVIILYEHGLSARGEPPLWGVH